MTPEITRAVDTFVTDLTTLVQAQTRDRVLKAFNKAPATTREPFPYGSTTGTFAYHLGAPAPQPETKPRRKTTLQLCPSPHCKTAAAPAFGMLCAKHKDAPKATVAKWREARRARKGGR